MEATDKRHQNHIAILSPMGRNPGKPHGGITPVITNLAEGFDRQGIKVDLLIFAPEDEAELPYQLPSSAKIYGVGRGSKLVTAFRLWKYLNARRPHLLLAAGHRANIVASWTKIFFRPGIPIWGSVHNTITIGEGTWSPFRKWKRHISFRVNYKSLDGLIAVSQGVACDLSRVSGISEDQIHVIHNPIFDEKIIRLGQQPPGHEWFLTPDIPIILGAGRLERQKDFQTLIRAFAKVRKQRECRLIILGEGKHREELLRLVSSMGLEDCVDLPGFVPNPFSYMKRASVFVLSSRWEGFGNVLVEAMALGTPVVSTKCPSGPEEILEHGRLGPLVPVQDHEALASAILQTLDNPTDKELLVSRAKNFQISRATAKYTDLLFGQENAKIAFYGFHTGPGGIGHVMINLINGMASRGLDVSVLITSKQAYDIKLLHSSVKVMELGRKGFGRHLKFLINYLKNEKPDILISNKERTNRLAIVARTLSAVPVRIVLRVGTNISTGLAQKSTIKRWLRKRSVLYSFSRADQILAVSDGVKKDVLSVTGMPYEKIMVVPNPIITPQIEDMAMEEPGHPWLRSLKYPVILSVGRLVGVKDFSTLIKAVALVNTKHKYQCRLLILGEGKLMQSLKELAKELGIGDSVDFPGFVDNPYAYMARAKLFVLSSRREGSPNALIEALSLGLPVVSTDCESGPREILDHGRYGRLVPVGDARAMARAIIDTLNTSHSPEFLKQAVKCYRVEYSINTYLEALGLEKRVSQ